MEAKELMIGDWLFYRGQFNAFCFRVDQITRKKVGYHAEPNECRMHYLRLSECQPLPLTVKRLELIGFEKVQDQLYFLIEKNKVFFTFHYDLSGCNMFINGIIFVQIRYVHQLQHALKLCGIEKEITIY